MATSFRQQTNTEEGEQYQEGPVARRIERQTAKIPSDMYLWAAVGSIGLSLGLQLARRKHGSVFVGQWAPTFLLLGLYNKLVKVAGSDRHSRDAKPRPHEAEE
jgi:hypothetical protein